MGMAWLAGYNRNRGAAVPRLRQDYKLGVRCGKNMGSSDNHTGAAKDWTQTAAA